VNPADVVSETVALLVARPEIEDAEAVRILREKGASEIQATKAVGFVPLAFARHMLAREGPRFSDTYRRLSPEERLEGEFPLDGEVLYVEALSLAEASWDGDSTLSIVNRCPEFHAVNKARERESGLSGLELPPPAIRLSGADAAESPMTGERKRKWWRFW
jgi:hypothetical protein